MDRYDSDPFVLVQADERPLAVTDAGPEVLAGFGRADLVFYGVDHSGPSYEAWVFLNNPHATLDTPPDPAQGFAGRFTVFGHGGCYGEAGHCDVADRFRDQFDVRGDHPLTPFTIPVDVTAGLRLIDGTEVRVNVIPRVAGPRGPRKTETMSFEHLRLVTYDSAYT